MRILVLSILALPALAFAQSNWVMTDADFRTQSVGLVALDAKGVTVSAAGDAKTLVGFDKFLELQRPAASTESTEKFAVYLANGDLVRGEPTGTAKEKLQWKSGALGAIEIPLRDLRAMVRAGKAPEGIDDEHKDDVVMMTNGDNVKGIIGTIAADKVTMSGSDAAIPLKNVAHIFFAAPAQKKQAPAKAFRVKLTDGSIFTAPAVEVADDKLTLKLASAQRQIDLSAVVLIEQVNGPVSWLSSRIPDKIEQTPFLEESFPPRMDRTVEDKPIRFGKTIYPRGIGVHSRNVMEWELDGSYAAFRTQYAIDEGRNEKADVTVRIRLNDQVVYEQKNVRAGKLSDVIVLPLKGATRLGLEVDFGEGIHTQDRLNWIGPALVRNMPPGAKPATIPALAPATAPSNP